MSFQVIFVTSAHFAHILLSICTFQNNNLLKILPKFDTFILKRKSVFIFR